MSEHLSKAQLELLKAALLDERGRLATQAPMVADDAIGDTQDHAAEAARLEREVRIGDHTRARLAEVEAALFRIEDGSYGVCEETGEPIPFARLQLEPTTRYTVEALEQLEHERARDRVRDEEGDDRPY